LNKNNTSHIGYIESLRAIAALMVVVFHFISFYNGSRHIVTNESIKEISKFGAQGVELFYMISGFVIFYALSKGGYTLKNYPKYLAKRIIRIFPTYLATVFSIIAIGFLLTKFLWGGPYAFDMLKLIANITFTADLFDSIDWMNPIFITLKVELQFYIIIGLLFPLMKKSNYLKLAVFTAFLFLGIYTQNHQTVFVNSPYFIIGISLYGLYENKKDILSYITIIAALVVLAAFYVNIDLYIALIGILLIHFVRFSWIPLESLGKASYSLYLTHGLSGGWLLYFSNQEVRSQQIVYILIVSAIIFSILVAFLYYNTVEKRSIRIGKKIKYTP
jgi:exopolysaccharide production protein ExoZ